MSVTDESRRPALPSGAPLNASVLSWLRCFDATARCLSFTQAADGLCISQGAVSQQVRLLEEWLGRSLFERRPRALALTPDGRRLAAMTAPALATLASAVAQLRLPPSDGTLALGCAPSFAMGWLTPRLGDCFRRHPGLALRVVSLFTVPRDLPAEGLDAWIGYQPEPPAGDHVEPLLDEWLLPVASPAWLASPRAGVTPADLLHDDQPWPGAHASDEWACWLAAVAGGLRREPARMGSRLAAGGGAVARLSAEALAPLLGLFAGPAMGTDRAPPAVAEPPVGSAAGPAGPLLAPPEAWAAALAGGRRFNLVQLSVAAAQAGQGVALARLSLVADELAEGRLLAPWGVAVHSPARYWLVASSAAAASPALGLLRDWLHEALAAEAQARRQQLQRHGLVQLDGRGQAVAEAGHRR